MFPKNVIWVDFRNGRGNRGDELLPWKEKVERRARSLSGDATAAVYVMPPRSKPRLVEKA